MSNLAQIIPFRRPSADDLMDHLTQHVAALQHQAMKLQSAAIPYGEIIVPRRFEHIVRDGSVMLLGRKVIAGDVGQPALLVHLG